MKDLLLLAIAGAAAWWLFGRGLAAAPVGPVVATPVQPIGTNLIVHEFSSGGGPCFTSSSGVKICPQ